LFINLYCKLERSILDAVILNLSHHSEGS